jgi:hypothetical protein
VDLDETTECAWTRRAPQKPGHSFCRPQKVDRENPWVGLLARKVAIRVESPAASPSPAVVGPSGVSKPRALAHSGGTAPDLHRLPCYALMGTQGERSSYHAPAAPSGISSCKQCPPTQPSTSQNGRRLTTDVHAKRIASSCGTTPAD